MVQYHLKKQERCSNLVRHGLEKDGRSGYLLLFSVEPVSQMSPVWQIQSHDPTVGLHDGGINGKIGRRSTVGLHVDAPVFGFQPVSSSSTILR